MVTPTELIFRAVFLRLRSTMSEAISQNMWSNEISCRFQIQKNTGNPKKTNSSDVDMFEEKCCPNISWHFGKNVFRKYLLIQFTKLVDVYDANQSHVGYMEIRDYKGMGRIRSKKKMRWNRSCVFLFVVFEQKKKTPRGMGKKRPVVVVVVFSNALVLQKQRSMLLLGQVQLLPCWSSRG